jgi:hypothetical protein
MEKVVQTSQNDFEESGVDHSTLDEMRQVCCNLAAFPAIAPSFPLSQLHPVAPSSYHFFYPLRTCQISPRIVFARCNERAMAACVGGDGRLKAGLSCRSVLQLRGRLSIWVTLIAPAQLPHPPRPAHHCPIWHSLSCDSCLRLLLFSSYSHAGHILTVNRGGKRGCLPSRSLTFLGILRLSRCANRPQSLRT